MVGEDTKSLNFKFQLTAAKSAIGIALANCRTPVLTTKFTENSAVFLHLVSEIRKDIPVIWVDTGYNTRATLAYASDICARLQINLHTYRPDDHVITIPPALDDPEHGDFVQQVKLNPFRRAFAELKPDAWLSSIRRYQSVHRNTLSVFDYLADRILKVSPLLDWSAESVEQYHREYELPAGPPCFDPTKGEPMRECGLHLDSLALSTADESSDGHRPLATGSILQASRYGQSAEPGAAQYYP